MHGFIHARTLSLSRIKDSFFYYISPTILIKGGFKEKGL